MSDREKLIVWWEAAEKRFVDFCRGQDNCKSCPYNKYGFKCSRAYIIDNLISNGVTVQKWIFVSERLPTEVDADERGFLVAYTTEGKKIITWWEDVCKFAKFVTHWMQLPEPPKECE